MAALQLPSAASSSLSQEKRHRSRSQSPTPGHPPVEGVCLGSAAAFDERRAVSAQRSRPGSFLYRPILPIEALAGEQEASTAPEVGFVTPSASPVPEVVDMSNSRPFLGVGVGAGLSLPPPLGSEGECCVCDRHTLPTPHTRAQSPEHAQHPVSLLRLNLCPPSNALRFLASRLSRNFAATVCGVVCRAQPTAH
jgi:hypothetical protein